MHCALEMYEKRGNNGKKTVEMSENSDVEEMETDELSLSKDT